MTSSRLSVLESTVESDLSGLALSPGSREAVKRLAKLRFELPERGGWNCRVVVGAGPRLDDETALHDPAKAVPITDLPCQSGLSS
jgi:hypothetical protein